ncbi:DUF2541 family protein [Aquimarina sp. I32.4]|uniref:DUF2541 family protein n=1 Tax=Aquimarina sp. I32.4 TaxID=2053903 RepID=UPI000CDF128F|nr:DUF2541 family protein [Aquimarina sp. I32.4]
MKSLTLPRFSFFLSILTILLISSSFTTTRIDWKHLGSRTVNYKLDKDVIKLTAKEGSFRKLKIKITGGSLTMHKMVVQYGNGKKDIIQLKHNFSRKSETRIIDLKGNKRIIRNITFIYDTKKSSIKKAKIHVFGKH